MTQDPLGQENPGSTKSPLARGIDELDHLRTLLQKKDPQQISRYRILGRLGQGGMATVYRAHDPQLQREVALKILKETLPDEEDSARFLREIRALARLKHPQIVTIHDVGQEGTKVYFTMDLVVGQTLEAHLLAGSFTWHQCLKLLAQVARAIDYAHGQGVIHRDLKPLNIMIDEDGQPRIMDFGLAKVLGDLPQISKSGIILGTAAYMPPEQAAGCMRAIGPRSDIYALGAILYVMLTGVPPFRGSSFAETIARVVSQEPPPPRQCNGQIPVELERITMRAMAKEPTARYGSAERMALVLERFLHTRPTPLRGSQPILGLSKVSWLMLIGLGCLLLGGGFWWRQDHQASPSIGQKISLPVFPQAWAKQPNRWPEAMAALESAIVAAPQQEDLYLEAAHWTFLWGRKTLEKKTRQAWFAQSETFCRRGLAQTNGSWQLLVALYLALCLQEKTTVAREILADLLKVGAPKDRQYWAQASLWAYEAMEQKDLQLQQKLLRQAQEYLECALRDNPNWPFFYAVLVEVCELQEKFSQSLQFCQRGLTLTSELPELYYRRGRIYFSQGSWELAWQDFQRVQELDAYGQITELDTRCDVIVLLLCGHTQLNQGKPLLALQWYGKAIERSPNCMLAYLGLGVAHFHQEALAEALVNLDKVLAIEPKLAIGYRHRAEVYHRQLRLREAVDDYTQSLTLAPHDCRTLTGRGQIYYEIGMFQEALADLTQALKVEPLATAYYFRGSVYFQQEEYEKAIADWRASLSMNHTSQKNIEEFISEAQKRLAQKTIPK